MIKNIPYVLLKLNSWSGIDDSGNANDDGYEITDIIYYCDDESYKKSNINPKYQELKPFIKEESLNKEVQDLTAYDLNEK